MMTMTVNAQKGTVEIFSELKGTTVYLDEVLKGTDIITLDSIVAGTHYLKITKDSVNVYGELITVQPNEVTTILVKNNQEVQNKILASKQNEIQEYKRKKIDIILSQDYVTETKGTTSSIYFPGYYITTGTNFNNSTSTSTAYTNWKIIQGGNKEISDITFAKLIDDKEIVDSYNVKMKKFQKQTTTGLLMEVGGLLVGLGGLVCLTSESAYNAGAYLFAAGLLSGLTGRLIETNTTNPDNYHLRSVDYASKQAFEYNQKLKKELGLPNNYE